MTGGALSKVRRAGLWDGRFGGIVLYVHIKHCASISAGTSVAEGGSLRQDARIHFHSDRPTILLHDP